MIEYIHYSNNNLMHSIPTKDIQLKLFITLSLITMQYKIPIYMLIVH